SECIIKPESPEVQLFYDVVYSGCGTSTQYSQSLVAKEQAKNLQEDRRERHCRCGCRVTFVSLGGREKRDLSTLGVLACGRLDD
ncbi:hypothetical protein EI555_009348, partial [Monodon monoceros]